MSATFFPSSPASDQAPEPKPRVTVGKLPFDELPLGQSFSVPLDGANVRALRAQVVRKSKDGKRFVLVIHKEHNVIEIARKEPLPVAVPDVKQPFAFVPSSTTAIQDVAQAPTHIVASWGPAEDAVPAAVVEHTVGSSPAFGMPFGGGTVHPVSWGNEPTDWSNGKDAE